MRKTPFIAVASGLVGTLLASPSAYAGRWVDADPETKTIQVPDGTTVSPSGPGGSPSGSGGNPGGPGGSPSGSGGSPDGSGSPSACDPDQDLPNLTQKTLVQEAIINETTEKTTPAVTVERRNKALQSTTTSLPDQMLSVSTFSKVEGNALSKYAYETWGKFSRTTTVQPFENWEVTKWQERVQRLTEKTYELTTWDQLVSCPSGHITSQMVDYEMTTEGPFTEYTPWSAKSSEKLVSLAEDPPVVTESMIATYSKIVLLQKQMLAKFSNVAAGSEAKASMPFAGDKGRHAGRAGTAGASQVRSTLGSGQVKASAAASTLTSYGGAQASAMLASIQQKVQLYATGFNASLVLAQGFVWYQGKSHAVKKVTTQGQNLFSVSFVGPGGNIIEATLKP